MPIIQMEYHEYGDTEFRCQIRLYKAGKEKENNIVKS